MEFTIHPHKGVNDIEFGMDPDEVLSRIEGTCALIDSPVRKKSYSLYFEDKGVTFHFSRKDDRFTSCDFYGPTPVMFHGINVISLNFGQLAAMLLRLDPSTMIETHEAVAFNLVIAIETREAEEFGDQAPLWRICMDEAGAFDDLRPGASKKGPR